MSNQNFKPLWDETLKQIREEYENSGKGLDFERWFTPLDYVDDNISEIEVSFPSDFWLMMMTNEGHIAKIEQKFIELTGQEIKLKSCIKPKIVAKPQAPSASNASENTTVTQNQEVKAEQVIIPSEPVKKQHPLLKDDYTFETFVTGENSNFAYNVALSVTKNPGKNYNPMLIYGGVGLGKTHLMQAIGNRIYQESTDSRLKICYTTAENFTNEFTTSLSKNEKEKFKEKYRNLNVLLLDDIHFFIGKKGTQEELFHTFEALHQKNAQMVFTCDRPISELEGLEDRLRTRFSSGISIDLNPPDYETRCAIIQKKLNLLGQSLTSEVIDYVAQNVQTNVRDLNSCINKLIGYKGYIGSEITVDIARNQINGIFGQNSSGEITIEQIQKVVADHYNISLADLKSKKKSKKYANPRHVAIYLCRILTEYSFPELGTEFGGRDHTTAMHSFTTIETQLKTDSSLDATVNMLKREIQNKK